VETRQGKVRVSGSEFGNVLVRERTNVELIQGQVLIHGLWVGNWAFLTAVF